MNVSGEKKGVLIPKITLSNVIQANPFNETVDPIPESLFIYNTRIGTGVVEGYYYWDNHHWNKLITQTDGVTRPTINNLESFENTMTSTMNGVEDIAPIINTVITSLVVATAVDIPEPWSIAGGTTKVSSNIQNIYQQGSVGVGIGHTSLPIEKLDVNGNARIRNLVSESKADDYVGSYSDGILLIMLEYLPRILNVVENNSPHFNATTTVCM